MAAYDPENVFLKIIEGSVPSFKLFETEHVLAILDAFPLAPGHALLLPKARYATVAGADRRSRDLSPPLENLRRTDGTRLCAPQTCPRTSRPASSGSCRASSRPCRR